MSALFSNFLGGLFNSSYLPRFYCGVTSTFSISVSLLFSALSMPLSLFFSCCFYCIFPPFPFFFFFFLGGGSVILTFSSPYGGCTSLCFVSFGDTRGYGIGVLVFAADVTSPVVGACFPEFFFFLCKGVPECNTLLLPSRGDWLLSAGFSFMVGSVFFGLALLRRCLFPLVVHCLLALW